MKHPTQPREMISGVERFKENKIVNYLLGIAPTDLNKLHLMSFSVEDWIQFNQLTGWSVCGFWDSMSNIGDDEVREPLLEALEKELDEEEDTPLIPLGLAAELTELIRDSAKTLLDGRADLVACHIIAYLSHVHNFGCVEKPEVKAPEPEAPEGFEFVDARFAVTPEIAKAIRSGGITGYSMSGTTVRKRWCRVCEIPGDKEPSVAENGGICNDCLANDSRDTRQCDECGHWFDEVTVAGDEELCSHCYKEKYRGTM